MFKRYKKSLDECFLLLKKIQKNPEEEILTANILQQILLKRIVECESRIRNAKKEGGNLKATMHNKDARLTKEEAKAAKQRIKFLGDFVETLHKLIWIFRDIGDGIAFIYISPFDIKPLAFKQSPGFISGKKGTRLERKILRAGNRTAPAGILIMNDLTNCLRYGDFTLANYGKILNVIECKSGKTKNRTDRDIRQLENVQKIMNYIENDATDVLYGRQGEFERKDTHELPHWNMQAINKLIQQSEKEGTSAVNPETGLAYIVSRDGNFEKMSQVVKGWKPDFMFSMVNEYKYNNTGYYPFTLLFDDPFAFYNGEFVIGIAFDTGEFTAYLEKNSIALVPDEEIGEFPSEYKGMFTFHMKSKEEVYSSLSNHFVGRIFAEFISAKWFFNEAVHGMENVVATAHEKNLIPPNNAVENIKK